jgi:glucokinase
MNVDRQVAVGVEIGGSKTTVALVDSSGQVYHRCYAKTLRGRPATATLDPYLRAVDSALAYAHNEDWQVSGIGISIPGALDHTRRRPLLVPLLPSLSGFPLCDFLESRYSLPAHLHVDVDAALLGEHRFGAGRGFKRLLYLTVNAVVGAALVINGELEHPTQQYIGHICHLHVSSNGPLCSCGKQGCINTMVSMDAIQKKVQRALRRGEEGSLIQRLLNREYFSPQLLAEEALHGDTLALQVYGEIGRCLSAAIAKYVDLFSPNVLILGGILGAQYCASDLLLARVRGSLIVRSSSLVSSMVELVPAALGNDAALAGAVLPLF